MPWIALLIVLYVVLCVIASCDRGRARAGTADRPQSESAGNKPEEVVVEINPGADGGDGDGMGDGNRILAPGTGRSGEHGAQRPDDRAGAGVGPTGDGARPRQ